MLGHLRNGAVGIWDSCNISICYHAVAVLPDDLFGCTVAIFDGHHGLNQGAPFELIGTVNGAVADV